MAPLRQPLQLRASTLLYRGTLLRESRSVARGRFRDKRLTMPVLHLIGGKDAFYEDDIPRRVEANGDEATAAVAAQAGHFLPEEDPEFVRERVLPFLA